MIQTGSDALLGDWLAAAKDSELAAFAHNSTRDLSAVPAAITEPWSTSPVERPLNRLKTIKRQLYGRARFELLRRRVLAAA